MAGYGEYLSALGNARLAVERLSAAALMIGGGRGHPQRVIIREVSSLINLLDRAAAIEGVAALEQWVSAHCPVCGKQLPQKELPLCSQCGQ